MPSKGIQAYSYITAPDYQVEFSVPGQSITKGDLNVYASDHLEVDSKRLSGAFNFSGQFSFRVLHNGGEEITRQWVDINTVSGNLEKGSLFNMFEQTSFVNDQVVVTHLFYDAGHGEVGLPNAHQCLVTVTPNASNWQADVAPPGSEQANKPFWKFVLPAAHDVGMNSMETPDAVIQGAGRPFVTIMKQSSNAFNKLADNATAGIIAAIAPNIVAGLAVTQKDKLDTILTIGARYFEFRPARIHDQIREYNCVPDSFYFTHGPIPGMLYDKFLHDVVAFLVAHPTEVVVVQLRWDGVPNECGRPNDDDLNRAADAALEQSNGSLHTGNLDDLHRESIESLRNSGRRLILLNSVDSLSTYTDEANATLDGDSIVREFENLNTDRQNGKAFTNIQCQATATNIRDVVIYSALSADVSNSCMMGTKAICDSKTLPWIKDHALDKLQAEQLIVIMNDFIDGATADVGIQLSRRRLDS